MLGSGMRSFAGSVLLQRNRRMHGMRLLSATRPGTVTASGTVTVIAIGATMTITAIGIATAGSPLM
jgi:hypothetical protein